jgi:hypothetical protein
MRGRIQPESVAGMRRNTQDTLRPLPAERYELAEWRTARANID